MQCHKLSRKMQVAPFVSERHWLFRYMERNDAFVDSHSLVCDKIYFDCNYYL